MSTGRLPPDDARRATLQVHLDHSGRRRRGHPVTYGIHAEPHLELPQTDRVLGARQLHAVDAPGEGVLEEPRLLRGKGLQVTFSVVVAVGTERGRVFYRRRPFGRRGRLLPPGRLPLARPERRRRLEHLVHGPARRARRLVAIISVAARLVEARYNTGGQGHAGGLFFCPAARAAGRGHKVMVAAAVVYFNYVVEHGPYRAARLAWHERKGPWWRAAQGAAAPP